jgi:hypothetical protein
MRFGPRRYWDSGQHAAAGARKNAMRYFSGAGKPQASQLCWTGGSGGQKPGKAMALGVAALRAAPEAMATARQIAAGA